jgi:hypothetical protein
MVRNCVWLAHWMCCWPRCPAVEQASQWFLDEGKQKQFSFPQINFFPPKISQVDAVKAKGQRRRRQLGSLVQSRPILLNGTGTNVCKRKRT